MQKIEISEDFECDGMSEDRCKKCEYDPICFQMYNNFRGKTIYIADKEEKLVDFNRLIKSLKAMLPIPPSVIERLKNDENMHDL